MDWYGLIVGALGGVSFLVGYYMVDWLLSRRKHSAPRQSTQYSDWIDGYQQGWDAAKNVYAPPMNKPWKPLSPRFPGPTSRPSQSPDVRTET